MNAFNILKERGFVQQCSNESSLKKLFSQSKVAFYVGFDPTADSLHIGNLVSIMAITQLQRAGHIPIVIIGGGTALIGDPSGKTKIRPMASRKRIETNAKIILEQLKRYLFFNKKEGMFLDNAKWLFSLNYIEFLRDIGKYFKVNEMIKKECYCLRLKRKEGLSFIEFNYQLLQAYDFLVLFEKYNCRLQMGGDDQWSNILAGVDLIRRIRGRQAFALTFPLIIAAKGQKMGKTELGTVWLDKDKTSPYDFYQYWINIDDKEVIHFLSIFTFLPMKEIKKLGKLKGPDLRKAKEILAFEATKITHGEKEAKKAQVSSKTVFAKKGEDLSSLPVTSIPREIFKAGISVMDLFCKTGLTVSKGEASRLIKQGGAYINDKRIISSGMQIKENLLKNNSLILRKGKKQYRLVVIK